VEEEKTPQDAQQAVGIPKLKGDAQTDIADGIDSKSIGHGPQASGKNGPKNKMRGLAGVGTHLAQPAREGRNAPAREEDANDHYERDYDRRDSSPHQFGRRFGSSEPGSGSKPAHHAHDLQLLEPG